jgi:hypothetical protein
MRFESRVIEVGLILTCDVALYSIADKALCQLDAVASDQYRFDFEKREVISYLKYERYGMSSKNPKAITISPSKTPSAWIGPKNGICGAV